MTDPSEYCQPADLHDHGLPRGALPNPGREIASVNTGTDIMSLDEHGFRLDDELVFRADEGGSLPAPLVEGTTKYAKPLTDSTFQVADTPGGAAINFTTAGALFFVIIALPKVAAIRWASALVDDMLPAHVVPLTAPYPVSVVAVAAQLAAWKLLSYTGQAPGTFAEIHKSSDDTIKRWARGIPLRGANVPASANLAVTGSSSSSDPRGWAPKDGSIP